MYHVIQNSEAMLCLSSDIAFESIGLPVGGNVGVEGVFTDLTRWISLFLIRWSQSLSLRSLWSGSVSHISSIGGGEYTILPSK